MFKLINKSKKSKFHPDFIAESVNEINFDYLVRIGIKAVFIDLDGTVVVRKKHDVSLEIIKVLQNLDLDIYIASNRSKNKIATSLFDKLNAKNVITPKSIWFKPSKKYYQNALKKFNLKPQEVVMIGDRYIQDIYGANNAGLSTVLVYKLDTADNFIDKHLSKIEANRTKKLLKLYINID